MKKLLRYLTYRKLWERLPVMLSSYSTDYQPSQVDRDTARLMHLTQTRCPHGVELLRARHRGASPAQLAYILPRKRRRVRPLARLLSMVQRFAGLTNHDPMRSIARQHMRRGRT